jgi:hypothetical protein
MPFDISTLPKPPPKVRLAPGAVKKEAKATRRDLKRNMLAEIASKRHGLEYQISMSENPKLKDNPYIRRFTKEEAEKLLQENAYDNFLKRQLFNFASWPHRYPGKSEQSTRELVDTYDPRHPIDFANADKYRDIWGRLTPAEKNQVIAASGKPDYKFAKKMGQYLPSVLPKTAVKNPDTDYSFYRTVGGRKAGKLNMLNLLKKNARTLEERIATPNKYSYPKTPGNLMPEKEADEERKKLEREIFKDRTLFKLGRGHDERYGAPGYNVNVFNQIWGSMPESEKDAYIAQSKVGMSPAIAAKKYGIPSIISQLPEPKKPEFAGVKKTTEGSRHFEKQKMLSSIQNRDEALRKQIRDRKLSAEKASPLIKQNEYENFLQRKLFKFSDPSYETALKTNPFDYQKSYEQEYLRRFPGIPVQYMRGTPFPGLDASSRSEVQRVEAGVKAATDAEKLAYEKNLKDLRSRQDTEGYRQYEKIWSQLTPTEKNQVMQASNYTPKGIDYYMPPIAPPVAAPIAEQKVVMEQAPQNPAVATPAAPNLFPAPIPREVQLEESRRMKMERDAEKAGRAQLEHWRSISPAEKQQILYNQQVMGHLGQQQQTEYQRQQRAIQRRESEMGIPFQQGMGISPIMMNELMNYMESQPTRYIPLRPRRSINEKIMSNFDPNMFSPEFIPEEQ